MREARASMVIKLNEHLYTGKFDIRPRDLNLPTEL